MKPDNPARTTDRIERAHLRDPNDRSHTMDRYEPPDDLAALVQRFWVPVWSVAAGSEAAQQVLQSPCALIVITNTYARFYGVTSGLSTIVLTGDGWAFGTLLQPSAGFLIAGGSMTRFTDRFVDLAEVLGERAAPLVEAVRWATAGDDRLINDIVACIEQHPEMTRVADVVP